MVKALVKATKKIIALTLALILLFNNGAEIYGYALEISEEISAEIRESLQEVLAEQEGKNSYQKCLLGEEESCKKYLEKIKKEFIQSAEQAHSQKSTIESQKTYKEFKAEYEKAIAKEYNKAIEEIEKEEREAIFFSNLTWKEINEIKALSERNKKEAEKWKQAQEDKIKDSYKDYEVSYEKWRKETEEKIEEAGKKYLKEEGRKIIKAYNASNNKVSKEDARELLVALINSEEKPGEIVAQREEAAKILREALLNNPCAYNKGGQKLTKGGADKYIGYDKPGVYPSLTREDWEIIPASYKDEKACQNAFISLDGLSKLQGTKENQTSVVKFMEANRTGLAAGDSLLEGSAVLLKWKAYITLRNYMKQNFALEKNNENKGVGGFGGISETVAYNGKYLGEVSVWTQRADGSNAWEELASLLAEEGSVQSQELLKMSLSSCKVVKEVLGRDKLECGTILPFLYGALISAPKVMDKAEPYQEAIPLEKEYMDKNGRLLVIDKEGIKRRNALIKKEFKEKIREYGSSVSRGLAGFLYNIKFNDMPVDAKMALDNRLAKVYSNIKGYSKGSKRYKNLQAGRAAVAIFKYVGIAADIWCFVSMAGLGVKAAGGASALIKAKNLMKGVKGLSVGQRAGILRQIAFIQEGAKLRRFGNNAVKFMVNSDKIGRRISAGEYLAQKNGMNTINYMLHNVAYGRGKHISLSKNILRVEGIESKEFYKNSHYIAGKHKDIFRINRDIRRGVKVGISELGEGGNVLSYIDKAKLGIFKNYTEDYLKGQEAVKGSKGGKLGQGLMKGETSLLPREVLYSRKYKKILPFVQDYGYTKKFKLGENIYEGLRGEGLYVYNTQTGQIFNDFSFHLEGYLNKEGILGGLTKKVRPGKALEGHFYSVENLQGSAINNLQGAVINNPQSSINLAVLNKGFRIENLLNKNLKPDFNFLFAGKEAPLGASTPLLNKNLPILNLFNSKADKLIVLTQLMQNIAKLQQVDISTFSPKKAQVYAQISKDLLKVSKELQNTSLTKLKKLEKMTALLNMQKPVLILNGASATPPMGTTDYYVLQLPGTSNYQARIAQEIKDFSSVFDEFMVHINMHGDVLGDLIVSQNKYSNLSEIVNIIKNNKSDSKVNLVSAACHSGTGFTKELINKDINILLLSGANDVCYTSDINLLEYRDLPATYLKALKEGRYGARLIYNGKVYNPIEQGLKAAVNNEKMTKELTLLKDIYLKPDISGTELGRNIFKLLSNFPNYNSPALQQLTLMPQISFIFNPVVHINHTANSYISKKPEAPWQYILKIFDDNNKLKYAKGVSFEEPSKQTLDFIFEAAKTEILPLAKDTKQTAQEQISTPLEKIHNNTSLLLDEKMAIPLHQPLSSVKPNSFLIVKTPQNIAKYFERNGLKPEQAQNLASICFEGEKQKYNPQVFEKLQELLQKGVEPKYIETMMMALSDKGNFSLDLYKKALALHEKYDLSLPVSAYMVSFGESSAGYDKNVYDNIEKLLKNNFDFSKISRAYNSLLFHKENNQIVKDLEISVIDILANFSKGPKEFDVEAWSNFIYLANRRRNSYLSFNYAVDHSLSMKDIFKPAWEVLGIKTVADALDLNAKRYTEVFRDLTRVIEPELFPLLKEKLTPLSEEDKLRVVSLLAASVNRRKNLFSLEDKKALIKKIAYKPAFKDAINYLVFDQLDLEYTERLGEIFDFSSNTYLNHILEGSYKFRTNLSLLYKAIKPNADKPIKQIFDELPENKAFAEICAQNGINYKAWRGYDPNDFITRKVLINGAKKPLTTEEITVRKVDMDNIAKALTTGNESSSCRSVGKGSCGEASPNLIKNKMVQQVEILVKERPVGNALIYLAEVDGQTSIIVGSFVKKVPYFSYEVTKLVLDYVRKIRQDITYKEIPIYYSSYLDINNYYKYPLKKHKVMLLGEGYDAIFNSFTHKFVLPSSHKTAKVALYTIEEGSPDLEITPDIIKRKLRGNDSDFAETIIENLSPQGEFMPKLYIKASELSQKYDDSMLMTSDLVGYCMQNGSFNEAIYEKIKLMYENKVKFNKLTMLRKCEVNGVFREDLFNKGMSLKEDFGSLVPQVIAEFTDNAGNFIEEYFKGFAEIAKNTKKLFFNYHSALKDSINEADIFKKAFDLLGVEDVVKIISSNRDRYLNIFRDLFTVVNDKNAALLKEKLAPLPLEKKLEITTLIAGSVDKKDEILGEKAIKALINKIPNEKVFKEEINRIVFKQFGFKYTPELAKIFDFSSNRYIALIMQGPEAFNSSFISLFKAFEKNINKPVKQIFDELPDNKAFAEICAENGINYQAWRGYDPNSFITRKVLVNADYSDPRYLQQMALLYPKYDINDMLTRKIVESEVREFFTVRKVDMDNIPKALTAGNESGSCRSVGTGACREAAPELIRNKMVQQVELVDSNNKVVGNVLIYLAEVDGELAIVMGSIVRRSSYYVSTEINELVIDYVRQMRKDIGRPDIPIYMSTYLKAPSYFPMEWRKVKLLGEGNDAIFNSFTHSFEVPSEHQTNTVLLYEVDEGETYLNGDNQFPFVPVSSLQIKSNLIGESQKEFFGIPVFKLDVLRDNKRHVGTGFYIKYRNLPFILTAAHVVRDNALPYVTAYNDNGFSMKTKIISISDKSDLAVLSVPKGKLDFVSPWTLALKEPEVGDTMFSVGYPKGGERKTNKVSLLSKYKKIYDNFFYLHDKGTITLGASGSPLSKDKNSSELFGVVAAVNEPLSLAISVPLPQIRTFLGEVIRQILFTPELNKNFLPLYPAFAKNYENVLNKYSVVDNLTPESVNPSHPVESKLLTDQTGPSENKSTSLAQPVSFKSFLIDFGLYPYNNKKDFFGLPIFKIKVFRGVKKFGYGTAFYLKYRNLPLLLTARHVVEGSIDKDFYLYDKGQHIATAEILAISPNSDLAVLTFPKGLLDYKIPYTLALKEPKVGDKAVSIGYPGPYLTRTRKENLSILDTNELIDGENLYTHNIGHIIPGFSGSPLSDASNIKKLFGVVVRTHEGINQAYSVPLPQIRTFLGEVIRQILFTPELNKKYTARYPAFAKNYENVLNKYNLFDEEFPDKEYMTGFQNAANLLGINTSIKYISLDKKRYFNIFKDLSDNLSKDNLALLKEKLAPLSEKETIESITMLAGSVNKKTNVLNEKEINDLINKLPNLNTFKEEINRLVSMQFGLEYTPKMAKIFDFASNKYISQILSGNILFDKRLTSLFNALQVNIDKPIHQNFDLMENNLEFAKMCAERGIDYQAWRKYDPNNFIKRNVIVNEGKEPITRKELIVRKVDMDDVLKALTSGNESSACRAVGRGLFREAAPYLVKNKMVQQVELLHNGQVVGNALIYLAEVNNKLAIVIGTIVKKSSYYASVEVNDLVVDYVRKIRQDIARPDIPIYMSSYLKVPNNYPMTWKRVKLLGTGYDKIFNSLTHKYIIPAQAPEDFIPIYKIDEGVNKGNSIIPFAKEQHNNIVSFQEHLMEIFKINKEDFSKLPVFKVKAGNFLGTGFYVKYRNLPFILTAKHVVKDSKKADIFNDNGFTMTSEVINISPNSDLALLSVEEGKLDFAEPYILALKEPKVGDKVLAYGYPYRLQWKLRKDKLNILQTDTLINNDTFYKFKQKHINVGSSGGPLVKNEQSGEFYGVVVSGTEDGAYAFSVPLPQIKTFLGEVIRQILFTPELNKKFLPLYPAFAKNYENVLNKYSFLDKGIKGQDNYIPAVYTGENTEKPLNLKTDIVKANYVEGKYRVLELRDAQNNIRAYYKLTRKNENDRTKLFDKIITKRNLQSKYPLINIEYPKILSTDVSDLPDGIIPEDIKCYFKDPYFKSAIITPVDASGWSYHDRADEALTALNGKPITNEEWAQVIGLFKDLNKADFYHNDLENNLFFKRDNNGKLILTIIDFEYFDNTKDMKDLNIISMQLESIGAKEKSSLK